MTICHWKIYLLTFKKSKSAFGDLPMIWNSSIEMPLNLKIFNNAAQILLILLMIKDKL